MRWEEAKNIATHIYQGIAPLCERIDIAGSLRRYVVEVKDIEIVALIKANKRAAVKSILEKYCYLKKGKMTGRYMQLQHKSSGIIIDLFMPMEYDYFRQFAIRTGSALYSEKFIACAWVKQGWVGTENGLRRRSDCVKKNNKWIVNVPNPVHPPKWESEKHFFDWLELEWVEPQNRNVNY